MTVIDPVCGMSIEEKDSAATAVYQGKTYFFCSPSCKVKFEKDPQAFVSTEAAAVSEAPHGAEGRLYTCPMHPEIRETRPGSCPKCGMALEPVTPSAPLRQNGPVPCTRKSCGMHRAVAPYAAWPWSRGQALPKKKTLN